MSPARRRDYSYGVNQFRWPTIEGCEDAGWAFAWAVLALVGLWMVMP